MTVVGDARRLPFSDGVAQCVVTSPPYYGLRNYNVDGQIGLEQTPAAYVAELVAVFREVWRVLRDDGVAWLNLGDSYGTGTKAGRTAGNRGIGANTQAAQDALARVGGPEKNLLGIPWRVAFALQDDGWYLRSDCIWHKPNPMPESVTDRPTKAHEYVFLLSKSARYYYDAAAVSEPSVAPWEFTKSDRERRVFATGGAISGGTGNGTGVNTGRNARTVWTIATRPYSGAHFATMPPALAEKCILAGTSERGACPKCGAAWVREVEKTFDKDSAAEIISRRNIKHSDQRNDKDNHSLSGNELARLTTVKHTGWRPACDCNAGEPVPCVVLDPFSGAGTTERVAIENGRRFIGTELNPKYVALRSERVAEVPVRML